MNKKIRATMYVVGGAVVIAVAIVFVVFLFLSAWLPGMYILRKVLYAVAFAATLLATWFVHEGYTYLKRHRRRW